MSSATSQTSATAVDLSIDLAGVALRNPILSASGTWSVGFAKPVPALPCGAIGTKKNRPLISPTDAVGE